MENDRHDALLTLILARGFGPTLIRRCVDAMGDPQAVVEASSTQLSHVENIGSKRASSLRLAIDHVLRSNAVEQEKGLIKHYDVTLIARGDEEYPLLLRHIPDPPPLLYVKGAMRKEDAIALDVVGARKCTVYGREQADRLSAMSSQAGLVIISGGAYGIDAVAHRAALRVKGRTIAVLGSGMANPYPKDHIELFGEIADPESDHGGVISELPMTTPPMRENFPRRNRIVSGMSLGVLVIEASSRSGALITARLCAEDHNREVLAVPGRVDSRASDGCHRIIREGWETLVTNVADVLDALGDTGQLLKAEMEQAENGHGVGVGARKKQVSNNGTSRVTSKENKASANDSLLVASLTESQQKIAKVLEGGDTLALDQIAAQSGLPVHVIQADMTMLQIRGLVARQAGRFVRVK